MKRKIPTGRNRPYVRLFIFFVIVAIASSIFKNPELSLAVLLLVVVLLAYLSFVERHSAVVQLVYMIYYAWLIFHVITNFALIYQKHGILYNGLIVHNYADSFYFSIVTWTTLGSNDFTPTVALRMWVAAETFLGYIFMSLFVALLLNFLHVKQQDDETEN